MFQPVDAARDAWLAGKLPLKKFGLDWVAQQWLYFLDGMPATLTCGATGRPRQGVRL